MRWRVAALVGVLVVGSYLVSAPVVRGQTPSTGAGQKVSPPSVETENSERDIDLLVQNSIARSTPISIGGQRYVIATLQRRLDPEALTFGTTPGATEHVYLDDRQRLVRDASTIKKIGLVDYVLSDAMFDTVQIDRRIRETEDRMAIHLKLAVSDYLMRFPTKYLNALIEIAKGNRVNMAVELASMPLDLRPLVAAAGIDALLVARQYYQEARDRRPRAANYEDAHALLRSYLLAHFAYSPPATALLATVNDIGRSPANSFDLVQERIFRAMAQKLGIGLAKDMAIKQIKSEIKKVLVRGGVEAVELAYNIGSALFEHYPALNRCITDIERQKKWVSDVLGTMALPQYTTYTSRLAAASAQGVAIREPSTTSSQAVADSFQKVLGRAPTSRAGTGTATFAYVGNSGSISVIDTASNAVVATVPLGGDTQSAGVAVHPTGTRVYVIAYGLTGGLWVIDTATNTVAAHPAGFCVLSGVAVHPAGTRIYVATTSSACQPQNVAVIDGGTNAVLTRITTAYGANGVAINAAGTRLYVTSAVGGIVSVIDTVTNAVLAEIPSVRGASAVTVHPTGRRVYVTNMGYSTVSVIDTVTNAVVATVPVGSNPAGVAVNAAGTRVYVANLDNTVSIIDTASNIVVTTVPLGLGFGGAGIAVHPAGTLVYVTNSIQNSVSVIDTATNTVIKTVAVGGYPQAAGIGVVASRGRAPAGDAPAPREDRHATEKGSDTLRLAGRWEGKTSRGDSFVWKIRDDGSIELDGKKEAGAVTALGASIRWSYSQSELARGTLTWLAGGENGRLAGTFDGSARTFELDYRPRAIVLAVPGIDFLQTLLPGDHAQPWKKPTYLQESVAEYFDANRIPATVIPFTLWRDLDIARTREAVQKLMPVLLDLADRARREGESFHVVAHSWGAVLTYLALSEIAAGGTAQGVHLDGLFTLGTQIGWLPYLSPGRLCLAGVLDVNLVEAAVKKALCRYAEPHAGLPLTNPGNAIRNWVNFYSTADSFSRDVPSPPAAKSTDVGRVGGLIQDHRQYYAWNHGGWTYDAELIRNRARAVLGEVALEIQLALRALRQAGPRPVAIRPAGLAVEPATR